MKQASGRASCAKKRRAEEIRSASLHLLSEHDVDTHQKCGLWAWRWVESSRSSSSWRRPWTGRPRCR